MGFQERVKEFRAKHGISLETLARELSVSYSTVNRWIRGHKPNAQGLAAFERLEIKYEDKKK